MLSEELRRVCELQPAYSPENTPAMQERGSLIRGAIPTSLRELSQPLKVALGAFGDEFDVGSSDGIGRKTEAPWVRFFTRSMSPTPRDGFYVVVHFAANGSAVFVTVGCGSTIWANGDLRSVSDAELQHRTSWAREVISERFGSTEPFLDEIALGAKAALPRTFEKATVIARRVPVEELNDELIADLLVAAAERLRAIYEAQRLGRHLRATDVAEAELQTLSHPARSRAAAQGFGLTMPERQAVEMRAMAVAQRWLEAEGFLVEDVSRTSSFDFRATKDGCTYKIEVKGTTSDAADAVFMTHNEVELHRSEQGRTGLIIVSAIRLSRTPNGPQADGGDLFTDIGWNIAHWELAPLAYRVSRRVSA